MCFHSCDSEQNPARSARNASCVTRQHRCGKWACLAKKNQAVFTLTCPSLKSSEINRAMQLKSFRGTLEGTAGFSFSHGCREAVEAVVTIGRGNRDFPETSLVVALLLNPLGGICSQRWSSPQPHNITRASWVLLFIYFHL